MSIELAKELKQKWTDRFVQVDESVPELRRFGGLTGQVKTVSMNGQVLVEFAGSEDIGRYDIHPQYLKIVTVETPAEPAPVAEATAPETPATAAPEDEQAPATEAPAPVDTGDLSPLELARLQDSSDAPAETLAAAPEAKETPATEAAPVDTGNLSPLELARLQDSSDAPAETPAAAPEAEQAPADEAVADDKPAEETSADDVEETVDETAAPAADTMDIPESGPGRVEAVLAACRAQDGG